MKWNTGTPPETEFCNDIYFVRIEKDELGCKCIKFTTNVWYGDRWCPVKSYQRITHWAYIEDPLPLEGNNFYEDTLGRLKCVVQSEVFPDLQTPPAKEI